MRPKPFVVQPYEPDGRFVIDGTTGTIWHRALQRVLYADTDRSGAVYHANYLRYFEFGRASLMRDLALPFIEVENAGYIYPVVETNLRYYQALQYDDPIWVHTRPAQLERVRVKFDYTITHAESGDLISLGCTQHCALNRNGVPVAVDRFTVDMWNRFPG